MDANALIEIIRLLDGSTGRPTPGQGSSYDQFVGRAVFIRTVTYHYTGLLVRVGPDALVLEDAAWVALSGRWSDALKSGTLDEVEPYPDGPVMVSRGAIVDVCEWAHDLPRDQK